jgi:hypothetical protein
MAVSAPVEAVAFEREVAAIEAARADHGPTERRELAARVDARFWGPCGSPPRCARRSRTGTQRDSRGRGSGLP